MFKIKGIHMVKIFKYLSVFFMVVLIGITILFAYSPNFRYNFFVFLHKSNKEIHRTWSSISEAFERAKEDSVLTDSLAVEEAPAALMHAAKKTRSRSAVGSGKTDPKIQKTIKPTESVINETSRATILPDTLSAKTEFPATDVQYLSENNGILYIETTPGRAQVTIEGKALGTTPMTVRLSPAGIYKVKIEKAYMDTWEKSIRVYPARVTKIITALRPGKGLVTLLSDPQAAEIFIDGQKRGKSPLTIASLTAGTHNLYIAKGELEYEGKLVLQTGEKKITSIPLKRIRTDVLVESDPAGAKIFIDGVYRGKTPATVPNVRMGKRQIILEKDNKLAFADSVLVKLDRQNHISVPLVEKKYYKNAYSGSIRINSAMDKAFIRIDGQTYGVTPLLINNLRVGEHELLLVKPASDGSYYFRKKLRIDANNPITLNLENNDFIFRKVD